MLVNLAIEKTQPLIGVATCDEHEPIPFVGWMGLLRAVSELVSAGEQATGAQTTPQSPAPAPLPRAGDDAGI